MKYITILFIVACCASCSNNDAEGTVSNTDSLDSVQQVEEDEMSKEIIEGSFDALNR